MPDQRIKQAQAGLSLLPVLKWCDLHPRRALGLFCLLFFLPGFFSLPPLDRDESRFAQATKQMVETGDYVEIRFQDVARNKKPVGIYWLQALPASVLGGPEHDRIWAYRLPSLLAAIAAVFLTYAIGRALFDTRTGVMSAMLLGSSTLLVVESGIAKTDAALLATTLWAMLALAVLYKAARDPTANPVHRFMPYSFWVATGLGLLIKGPVILLVLVLTILTLGIWDRSFGWLKSLKPLSGLALMALITLPWYVAIYQATDGAFFADAMGKDFGGKIVSGQESHGAPPGLYLALLALTFWPATLALLPAIPWSWRHRSEPAIRFLIAWVLPSWIVMELIPTKLPHYTLPLYPGLALLIGAMIVRVVLATKTGGRAHITRTLLARAGLLLWLIPALLLSALISLIPLYFGQPPHVLLMIASGLAALLSFSVVILFWRGRLVLACSAASLAGLFIFAALFEGSLGNLEALRLSPNLKSSLTRNQIEDASTVGILGYSEPSFIFLNGTGTHLVKGKNAVAFLTEAEGRTLLVEVRKDGAFQEALRAEGLRVIALDEVKGFNYSKGTDITMTLYQLAPEREAGGQ